MHSLDRTIRNDIVRFGRTLFAGILNLGTHTLFELLRTFKLHNMGMIAWLNRPPVKHRESRFWRVSRPVHCASYDCSWSWTIQQNWQPNTSDLIGQTYRSYPTPHSCGFEACSEKCSTKPNFLRFPAIPKSVPKSGLNVRIAQINDQSSQAFL